MIGEGSNKKILGGLLTLGTLVGLTIAGGFIIRGYLTVKTKLPSVFNEEIVSKLDRLNITVNPKTSKYSYIDENGNTVFLEDKNKLLDLLPEIQKVWNCVI